MLYERKEKIRSNVLCAVIASLLVVEIFRGDMLFAGIYTTLLVLEISI